MEYERPLIRATLIRRYKRFLADVVLESGESTTVHCPNTGAMLGCQQEGAPVWLLPATNPKRKYSLSWELVEVEPRVLVGINTGRSNRLVEEALGNGVLRPLGGYQQLRREVTVEHGGDRSRVDFLLTEHASRPDCYVEVKNVTAAVSRGTALFPDAVSTRASKHLAALMTLQQQGFRAALVFCVQRSDVSRVRPAGEIDPVYAQTLGRAAAAGVEIYAYGARVSPGQLGLVRRLGVVLD
jgi:sugar fermentation stimulation protein A